MRNTPSRVSQLESLEKWSELLKPGMVVVIRASAAERGLEAEAATEAIFFSPAAR